MSKTQHPIPDVHLHKQFLIVGANGKKNVTSSKMPVEAYFITN